MYVYGWLVAGGSNRLLEYLTQKFVSVPDLQLLLYAKWESVVSSMCCCIIEFLANTTFFISSIYKVIHY